MSMQENNIISIIQREYTENLTSPIKRQIIEYLMNNKIVCKTGNNYYSDIKLDNKEACIKSINNGCWGYGGDSIAVEIADINSNSESDYLDVDNLYPSSVIINLNVNDDLFNNIIKVVK